MFSISVPGLIWWFGLAGYPLCACQELKSLLTVIKSANSFCIVFLHFMVKMHGIRIRHCYHGIYPSPSRYSCVHCHDLFWNDSNWSILLSICFQYLSQVWYGDLAWLDTLCVLVRNWNIYWQLMIRWWLLNWCLVSIVFVAGVFFLAPRQRNILYV